MLTDTSYIWFWLVSYFFLLAVALSIVFVGLYPHVRAAISFLRRLGSDGRMARGTGERIAEIRNIGQQARREMEEQQFEFLNTVSHLKGR